MPREVDVLPERSYNQASTRNKRLYTYRSRDRKLPWEGRYEIEEMVIPRYAAGKRIVVLLKTPVLCPAELNHLVYESHLTDNGTGKVEREWSWMPIRRQDDVESTAESCHRTGPWTMGRGKEWTHCFGVSMYGLSFFPRKFDRQNASTCCIVQPISRPYCSGR